MQRIRCILVGDTGVGKTTLLRKNDGKSAYDFKIYQDCPRCYKTFSANIYSTKVEIGETSINLEIWDTSECDETKNCETLDSKSYPYSDVYMVCFSLVDPKSFQNAKLKWYSGVWSPYVRVVLVGTKLDLREVGEASEHMITYDQGLTMADQLKAEAYIECSSISNEESGSFKNLFDEILRVVLHPQKYDKNDMKTKKSE